MSTRVNVVRVADDYLDLVRQFPLRAIRNESEHAAAGRMLTRLLGRQSPRLSEGEGEYLDALLELAKAYELRAHSVARRKFSPLEMLRYLMRENNMNSGDLGKVLGNKTAASLVLNGKRELSKSHIRRLAARFKVEPGLFL